MAQIGDQAPWADKSARPRRRRRVRLRRSSSRLASHLRNDLAVQSSAAGIERSASPEVLQDALISATTEIETLRDQLVRTRAEMENFRKRVQRDKDSIKKFAIEEVVRDLVPSIDNLERAVSSAQMTGNAEVLIEGVRMIMRQQLALLEARGVERTMPLGYRFDPQFHEAVATMTTEDPQQDGVITEVVQAGYVLNGRVVRPALVAIAKAASRQ